MPRVRSLERLAVIVDAATELFGRVGFLQAQMVDIAAAAGVSVGTLYNYVEGKEALLLLCVENPFGGAGPARTLPVPVLDRVALIEAMEATLERQVRVPALEHVLERPRRSDPSAALPEILDQLFELLARTRRAADAMERCANEAPDLADLFYRNVRARLLAQLSTYCAGLIRDDAITATRRPEIAARFILETTTWWARHRHHDPERLELDDREARRACVALVTHGLCGRLDRNGSVPGPGGGADARAAT